ncbi:hypothetical protein EBZ39_04395 [bacterium]|nr:hypothetical protein [bacterium]
MANVAINSHDTLQFVNIGNNGKKTETDPTVLFQAGEWGIDGKTETGIIVDVFGDQMPLLTTTNARKLARWLEKAADNLDGVKHRNNKRGKNLDEDDSNNFLSRY